MVFHVFWLVFQETKRSWLFNGRSHAYWAFPTTYWGFPIAIGRSRLPIGRSRKFIGVLGYGLGVPNYLLMLDA